MLRRVTEGGNVETEGESDVSDVSDLSDVGSNDGLWFSLAQYSEEDQRDIVTVRKYSEKRMPRKNESDASYRKYLEHAESKMKDAPGMWSYQLAEAIARRWGRDTVEVEQELIDF